MPVCLSLLGSQPLWASFICSDQPVGHHGEASGARTFPAPGDPSNGFALLGNVVHRVQSNRKLELDMDLNIWEGGCLSLLFGSLFLSLSCCVCLLDLFGGVEHRAYSWLLSLLSGSLGFWGFGSGVP